MKWTGKETVSIEHFTPRTAQKLLDTSPGNRRINRADVDFLVKSIKDGQFFITPEGIGIDINGNLREGHHRLIAIVEADRPVWMVTLRNMNPEAVPYINVGRSRSIGDAASFMGWDINSSLVSAAKYVAFGRDYINSRVRFSHAEMYEMYEARRVFLETAANFLGAKYRKAVVVGVVARALIKRPDQVVRIKEFCDVLNSGVATKLEDTAAIRLRELIARGSFVGSVGNMELYDKTQSALSSFLHYKPLTRLYPAGEEF